MPINPCKYSRCEDCCRCLGLFVGKIGFVSLLEPRSPLSACLLVYILCSCQVHFGCFRHQHNGVFCNVFISLQSS